MRIDRRTLLVAGGAGVGLVVAFLAWPRAPGSVLSPGKGETAFGHYLKVATDGRVIVAIPQAETGQGIWTGLAQVAADALGAAWDQVAVEPAPLGDTYANDLLGLRATAAATSVRALEPALREAGEVARGLLVRVAAARWGVDPSACRVASGIVRHENRVFGFGELAADAAKLSPGKVEGSLDTRLIGTPVPRLDAPAKCDGSMRFAADVRLPDLRFASARFAPRRGRVTGFDRDAAKAVKGVERIVATDDWVAAIASNWWTAEQAMRAAAPRYQGPASSLADVMASLDAALDAGDFTRLAERGDFADTVGDAHAFAATYRIAPALHEGLEPLTATARFANGRLEVWAPVQAYDAAVAMATAAAGLDAAQVTLYPMPVGDPSGRALEPDAIPLAVRLAKEHGKPVQLVVPPSESINRDRPRPPLVGRMAAMPAPDGTLAGWSAKYATSPGFGASLARLEGKGGKGDLDLDGAAPPYGIPSLRIDAVAADLPIDCSYYRGGSAALTTFATESFIDELARRLGREPFAFRMAMLSGNPRLAGVLSDVTTRAGWDGGVAGSRMGLACASAFGSHIALVAIAGLDNGQIAVERLIATVDCGRVVNPGLVRQQIEGSLLQSLALATMAAPEFVAGMPVARSRPPSVFPTPKIDVQLINSKESPGGVSGLGHAVLAASLANALAAGTGQRLRNCPFDPNAA